MSFSIGYLPTDTSCEILHLMIQSSRVLEIAERIVGLRTELAAREAELARLLGNGPGPRRGRPPGTGKTGSDGTHASEPVSIRVRRTLAARGPMEFGELYTTILKTGEATKFAVKSALNKGRERGEIKFSGGRYSLLEKKKATKPSGSAASITNE